MPGSPNNHVSARLRLRPIIIVVAAIAAFILSIVSGAASAVIHQLPRQLNPSALMPSAIERLFAHRIEPTLSPPAPLPAGSDPTPQTLPYSQNFSSLAASSTTYPDGWQGWNLSTSGAISSFRTNAAVADDALIASSGASNNTGGVHNYNGKIGFLQNGSSNDASIALAVDTTNHVNVKVSYDIMTIRNPNDGVSNTRINQATLQYRVGTSGSFTSLTGIEYLTNTTNQTGSGVTTPQNSLTKTLFLPADCDNQSVVELRWAGRDVAGAGLRPSFAIDNITINGTQAIVGTLFNASGNPITDGRMIKLIQNGTVSATAATTNSLGTYIFNGLTLSSGDRIATFIDGASEKGVTATLIGTPENFTNLDLKASQLTVRTDNGGSPAITNSNLAESDSSKDSDIPFAVSSGTLTTTTGTSLRIDSSSTFTPGGNINDGGNWENNGTFTPGTFTVAMNGTANQMMGGASPLSFYNLTIDNPGSVSLANNLLVDNALNLTNGVVNTGSFTLRINGIVSRTNGWISGNEQRYFSCPMPPLGTTCSITFDVGTANGYSPVSEVIHVNANTTYNQTIKATETQHPSIAGSNALQRYWTVGTPSPAIGSADIIFKYRGGAPTTGDVVGDEALYKVFKYDSGFSQPPNQSVDTVNHIATVTGVTSFSDWTLAERDLICPAINLSPATLPVGWVGAAYNNPITASGAGPYTFTATGTPPTGLTLNSDGTWSGMPSAAGTFNFTVTASDANGCQGSQAYSVTISTCHDPFIVDDEGDTDDANAATAPDGVCADSNGKCTLRAAIQEANADTPCGTIDVNFDPVVHAIVLESDLPAIQHDVNINGPGAGVLSIDGACSYRVFKINAGYTVAILDLTIRRGYGDEGGGILNEGGAVALTNCVLSFNTADESGGAIYSDGGSLTLNNSTLKFNTTDGDGGGIYNTNSSSLIVNSSTISDNSATYNGGGIFTCAGSSATFTNSTVSGNTANDGGGIFNEASLKVFNSTISGNTADNSGGGIYDGGTLALVNVTIIDNHCDNDDDTEGEGGGIEAAGGSPSSRTLRNTIVAGNFRGSVFGLLAPTPDNSRGGGGVTGSFNLIGPNSDSPNNSAPNHDNLLNVTDPKLGPLDYYGGPTQTHGLLIGSPAIDAGDNCVLSQDGCGDGNDALTTDQRGGAFDRNLDGDGANGAQVDVGAFEFAVGAATNGGDLAVNTTSDHDDGACDPLSAEGDCTLREAINAANASPDYNQIKFDIPTDDAGYLIAGTGVWTIRPQSLPAILYPVTIDGYTQRPCSSNSAPCSQVNTDPTGNDAILLIELSGRDNLGGSNIGLNIVGGSSTVRGLVINQFSGEGAGAGIRLSGNGGNTITGNFIGTDASGTRAEDDDSEPTANNVGIEIQSCAGNTIGGAIPFNDPVPSNAAAARNVISANYFEGILITGVSSSGNIIRGNFIGTDSSGTIIIDDTENENSLGNLIGIEIYDGSNNVVGNADFPLSPWVAGAGNVISGNLYIGVEISSGTSGPAGNGVGSNFIGTNLMGTLDLGNGGDGVELCEDAHKNVVGGSTEDFRNVIANNYGNGINLLAPTLAGNTLRLNSIHHNGNLGIDLGDDGVTQNDSLGPDADDGPNNRQNFPSIQSAVINGNSITISGNLSSAPSPTFTIDFYANASCNETGYGEGQSYIGSLTNVATDPAGAAQLSFSGTMPPNAGSVITATATDSGGSTSEFSQCFPATVQNVALSVYKSAPYPDLAVDQESTYTITVFNNGNVAASSATVKEAIPAGLALTSASGTNWTCVPAGPSSDPVGTVTCTFGGGFIASSGGSSSIDIVVKTPSGTVGNTITNKYSIDPTGGTNAPDPTTCTAADTPAAGCGAPVGPNTIGGPPPPPATADLSITKTDSPDPAIVGSNLTYAIAVHNYGPDTATSVLVTDTLPANVNLVSATPSQGSCSGTAPVNCSLGSLSNGADATVQIVVTPLPAAAGTDLANTASVSASVTEPNADPHSNSATATTHVNACPTNFTVTDNSDAADAASGDGVCATGTNTCTLRAAIQEANALASCGTININFSIGSSTITLTGGQLTINHDVNINGPAANSVIVNGNNASRVFMVNSGKTASISSLTISGGNGSAGDGGAIQNNGTLTLKGVTLSENAAINGGAIRSDGALVLANTTISGNKASGNGGGLYNAIGQATLTNVTVSNNRSDSDDSGSEAGGGIFRVSGNVLLHNTIVADNFKRTTGAVADDIGGAVDSLSSYNVVGTGSGGLINGSDHNQVGVASALLGALMNNGGPTLTHGLLYNSPALDAGDNAVTGSPLFVNVDQRGVTRPQPGAGTVDIGAYERQPTETRNAPDGQNAKVDINDVRLTFPCVPSGGCQFNRAKGDGTLQPNIQINTVDLSVIPVPGDAPTGSSPAFDVTPSSSFYDSPVTVCFYLPSITNASTFANLKVLHRQTDPSCPTAQPCLVDNGSTPDFPSKTVCTTVISFSQFVINQAAVPTATNGNVSGQIVDNLGNPVEGAAVRMSGTQNRLTVTDANGRYNFDEVETNGFYTVIPSRPSFVFSPPQRSFSALGQHTEAAFNASATGNALNPLDATEYFVRQQYLDFLGREPDEAGFNFWVNNIETCGANQNCRAVKYIDTSAAFFLSIEFQQTGYLVYRTYQAAYGDLPDAPIPIRLSEFKPDTAEIGKGVVVNKTGWEAVLETNKRALMAEFVQRSRFAGAYPTTMTPTDFVDKLFVNAGVTPNANDRTAAIDEFGSSPNSADVPARGRALRRVAENSALARQEFNQAFVLMQYFGYLRRDANTRPDTDFGGFTFWLNKLNAFNGNFGDAEMVKAFIVSGEYRGRFPR